MSFLNNTVGRIDIENISNGLFPFDHKNKTTQEKTNDLYVVGEGIPIFCTQNRKTNA